MQWLFLLIKECEAYMYNCTEMLNAMAAPHKCVSLPELPLSASLLCPAAIVPEVPRGWPTAPQLEPLPD